MSTDTRVYPRMPTAADQERASAQHAIYLVLTQDHHDLADEWRVRHVGDEASAARGPSDLSNNPLADICRQLSQPGMYGTKPVVRHADEFAEVLIGDRGLLVQAGYWTRMQWVQYLTLGLSEPHIVWDVDRRGRRLIPRLALPHHIYVETDPDDPTAAVMLWELRDSYHPMLQRRVYTWDVYDIRDEERPSYRIFEASQETDLEKMTDLSGVLLERPGGTERGELVGAAYPYRYDDGEPFIPHTPYRSVDSGRYWNHRDRRGAFHGTMNAIVYWSHAGHAARAASGSMAVAIDLDLGVRRVESGTPALTILPGTIMSGRSEEGKQGRIQEFGPGGHAAELFGIARDYSAQQALAWGLQGADVTRQHANPTSGAALSISDKGKRIAQRQYEEIFRRSDLESIRKAAAIARIGGLGALPEQGYSIRYAEIPDSPEEEADKREDTTWRLERGFLGPVEAYQRHNPGATRDEAERAIVAARVERIRLAEITREILAAEGLTPPAETQQQGRPAAEEG